jgi:transposase
MANIFWNGKVVLLVGIMKKGTAITSELHCETLKELRMIIQNERCGMLTYGVALFHDNARPHTTARTRALLEHFNWKLFDHPPYNPDLFENDYLFTYLKNWL